MFNTIATVTITTLLLSMGFYAGSMKVHAESIQTIRYDDQGFNELLQKTAEHMKPLPVKAVH